MRYQIIREMGSGAGAVVYLAKDELLRRQVALKKLHGYLLHDEDSRRRFQMEAVAIASLSHENIVRLHDVIQEDERWFLALEYIPGPSLEVLLLKSGGTLGPLITATLARQVVSGLKEAHRKQIIHRDIKPSNILMDNEGVVKLTDFGIAHCSDDASLTRTGVLLGTPHFMAPEQAKGQFLSDKTDIFSLGVVVFRCLCGQYPVAGTTTAEILIALARGQIISIHTLQSQLIPGLGDWIMSLLAVEPGSRPSAASALEQLDALLSRLNLRTDGDRLAQAIQDPMAARINEKRYLEAHFKVLATQARAIGKVAAALRYEGLGQLFGAEQKTEQHAERHVFSAALPQLQVETEVSGFGLSRFNKIVLGITFFMLLLIGTVILRLPHAMPQAKTKGRVQAVPVQENLPTSPSLIQISVSDKSTKMPTTLPPKTRVSIPVPKSILPKAHFQAQMGQLRIRTFPAFVTVWVGDSTLGITPLKHWTALSTGEHRLRLIRDGMTLLDTQLVVQSDDSLDLKIKLAF